MPNLVSVSSGRRSSRRSCVTGWSRCVPMMPATCASTSLATYATEPMSSGCSIMLCLIAEPTMSIFIRHDRAVFFAGSSESQSDGAAALRIVRVYAEQDAALGWPDPLGMRWRKPDPFGVDSKPRLVSRLCSQLVRHVNNHTCRQP
jgi:hypothetical protein